MIGINAIETFNMPLWDRNTYFEAYCKNCFAIANYIPCTELK